MTYRLALIVLATALLVCGSAAAERSEAALRACMKANLPSRSLAQNLNFSMRDRMGGMRMLSGAWYWRREPGGGQSGMLKLTAPPDLVNAAYLLKQNGPKQDFYAYIPALGKVRKLVGSAAEQSIFDTGLSAFDLKFLASGLQGGKFERLGAGTVGGRAAAAWRYTPPADPHILYDRIDLLVDEQWCLPLEAKLFGGVPWKILTLDPAGISQRDGRWLVRRATLVDQRDGSTTSIEISNSRIDDELPSALFDPRRFHRLR